jgi:hypothetical protein
MSKSRAAKIRAVVAVGLIGGTAGLLFREGLVPPKMSPVPALNLDYKGGWLIDWQLAEVKRDPALCERVIKNRNIDAKPIGDVAIENGCGIRNGVRVTGMGGARMQVDKMSCEAAAAVALWLTHEVQPLAETLFRSRVESVQHMGSYSCRNIASNKLWKNVRSEHATANALDIGGFALADGRKISVEKHWKAEGPEGQFLRAVHARACRYFRVTLGPNYNAAHKDHFHLDRGVLSTCR